jgi:hypothetical protein
VLEELGATIAVEGSLEPPNHHRHLYVFSSVMASSDPRWPALIQLWNRQSESAVPERTKPDDLFEIRVLGDVLYLSPEYERGAFAARRADRQLALAANPNIGSLAGEMVRKIKSRDVCYVSAFKLFYLSLNGCYLVFDHEGTSLAKRRGRIDY